MKLVLTSTSLKYNRGVEVLMKLIILGGTGLLGQYAALEAVKRGWDTTLVARKKNPRLLGEIQNLNIEFIDLINCDKQDLVKLFIEANRVIMAVGADDREIHVAPAEAFFKKNLVDLTQKVVEAASEANVEAITICGSYFTAYHRLNPQLKLNERHIYIQARLNQQEVAFKAGINMKVTFLEIPYVFGSVPYQVPMWKTWLFDRLKRMPVVFYPKGGSAIVTAKQVGQALINSFDLVKQHNVVPVVDKNLTWKQLLKMILPHLNKKPTVFNAPKSMSELVSKKMKRDIDKQGKESGIDPDYLMSDIMYKEIFFDPIESQRLLKFDKGGIQQAIIDSVNASYSKEDK